MHQEQKAKEYAFGNIDFHFLGKVSFQEYIHHYVEDTRNRKNLSKHYFTEQIMGPEFCGGEKWLSP